MTDAELERRAKQELAKAGLLPELVAEQSQFLETPDGLFAEIVIRDGAKIAQVESIVDRLKLEAGEPLDAIVRSIWQVERVGDPVQAYSLQTGSPRAAVQYPVDLRSGSATRQVWVDVTYLANKTFEEHGFNSEDKKRLVEEFVASLLKRAGASYWNPEHFPVLEINSDTANVVVSGASPGWAKRPAV